MKKDPASKKEIDLCMTMPGGGWFKLAPGQVTDDSELSFSLIWAILRSNKKLVEANTIGFENYDIEAKNEVILENQKLVKLLV